MVSIHVKKDLFTAEHKVDEERSLGVVVRQRVVLRMIRNPPRSIPVPHDDNTVQPKHFGSHRQLRAVFQGSGVGALSFVGYFRMKRALFVTSDINARHVQFTGVQASNIIHRGSSGRHRIGSVLTRRIDTIRRHIMVDNGNENKDGDMHS